MKLMAGIDLHSNNVVIGIMDQDGKRVASQKLPCELKAVVKFRLLKPKVCQRIRIGHNGGPSRNGVWNGFLGVTSGSGFMYY